jgi:hypothetical protein
LANASQKPLEVTAFYKQFWPDKLLVPEQFTIMLNTAGIDAARQVMCLLPLIDAHECKAQETEISVAVGCGSKSAMMAAR